MKRIFFSLYLVIVIALIVIGQSSDWILELNEYHQSSDTERVANLTKIVRHVENIENTDTLKKLSDTLGHTVTLIPTFEIAWPEVQKNNLQEGNIEILYGVNNDAYIYILNNHQLGFVDENFLIRIGPILFEDKEKEYSKLIVLLSYLLLAIAIGLWSYPLWRDLGKLQSAARKFGDGEFDNKLDVKANSIIYPVIKTYNRMAKKITRLIDDQKNLTNAVSHDLRTPLARLKFSLELLPETESENVKGMQNDINELESLIEELLSYGRLETETTLLKVQKININELIENLIDKLSINNKKNISLVLEENIHWLTDGHFLERAVQNLVTNAIRYSDSEIRVTVKTNNSNLLIMIEDDGPGIPDKHKADIFKPFIRLEKSRTKNTGGFGLGLAIVKRIADSLHGRCYVEDSAIGGAKMVIVIPEM